MNEITMNVNWLAVVVGFVIAFVLAWIVGVTAANNALMTMILIMLTIVFLMAGGGLFSQKSAAAISIEVSFVVAMAVIMIVCQGIL